MRIEAVTVCINYSDFLREAAPYNLPHFDRWVIVTTPADGETRELCRRHGLPCVLTNEVYRDGSEFNKGRAVLRGIDHLAGDGWVCHVDADMVLPAHFRHALEFAHPDPASVHGVDRVMVRGWDAWQRLQRSGWLRGGQWDYHVRVNFPDGYPVGARWASREYGYVPVGAFQLWSGRDDLYRGMRTKLYPHRHNDAARGDIQHGLQWDRRQRTLLPEIIAAHLESEPAPLGANWRGRTTKPFGPPAGRGA